MPISIICPQCANRGNVSESQAGRTITCRKCASAITVPAESSGNQFSDLVGSVSDSDIETLTPVFRPMKQKGNGSFPTRFPFIVILAAWMAVGVVLIGGGVASVMLFNNWSKGTRDDEELLIDHANIVVVKDHHSFVMRQFDFWDKFQEKERGNGAGEDVQTRVDIAQTFLDRMKFDLQIRNEAGDAFDRKWPKRSKDIKAINPSWWGIHDQLVAKYNGRIDKALAKASSLVEMDVRKQSVNKYQAIRRRCDEACHECETLISLYSKEVFAIK